MKKLWGHKLQDLWSPRGRASDTLSLILKDPVENGDPVLPEFTPLPLSNNTIVCVGL